MAKHTHMHAQPNANEIHAAWAFTADCGDGELGLFVGME